MEYYSFDELINRLPSCEEFPTQNPLPHGVSYGKGISEFVPPLLSVTEGELDDCQVVIVSAPGAVGKSTLAKALSLQRKALLWDLAAAEEVGFGSLDAMLEYTVQSELKTEFLVWMSEGMQFIIIDALDEGRVKVNESSFLRLLENVCRLAGEARNICFVLLGRTQITEFVWLFLDEKGIAASMLSIESFSRDQAIDYIDKRVSPQKSTPPFRECLDLIFQQLENSVTGSQDPGAANEFIHYPPVLDVVSILIDRESNPMRLKNSLENQALDNSVGLINGVINRILEREQREKVVPAVIEKLSDADDSDQLSLVSENLYSRDEQCLRLLGRVLRVAVDATPDILPVGLSTEYERAVAEALVEHPFLQGMDRFANSVFQSYLYARALRGDFGIDLRDRVTAALLEPSYLPSRLLAEFFLEPTSGACDEIHEIRPEHIGIIYDSLLSSESSRRHLRLSIDGTDPFDADAIDMEWTEGEFELLSVGPEGQLHFDEIPFQVRIDSDSVISFSRYMRNVHMSIPCTVELGSAATESKVGPAVYISASRIKVSSESLVIGGKVNPRPDEVDDLSITFHAPSFESPLLGGNVTVYTDDFSVCWPASDMYPWTEFSREHVSFDDDQEASLHRAYMRFKRIATAFRSYGTSGLAKGKAKIENQRTLQGKMGQALLAKLLDDGVLHLGDDGSRIFGIPKRLIPS